VAAPPLLRSIRPDTPVCIAPDVLAREKSRDRGTGDRERRGNGEDPASPSGRFGRGPRAGRYVSRPPLRSPDPLPSSLRPGGGPARTRPRRGAELRAPPGPPLQSWRICRAGIVLKHARGPDPRPVLANSSGSPCVLEVGSRDAPPHPRPASFSDRRGVAVRVSGSGLRSTLCPGYSIKSRPDPIRGRPRGLVYVLHSVVAIIENQDLTPSAGPALRTLLHLRSERAGGVSRERRPSTRGAPHGSASRPPDQARALFERSEFARAPAARAAEPMRVARAEEPPRDTPPARASSGTR